MIGTKVGPYEVLAHLGAGGMGEVFRARDSKLDRAVAIKILPESFANDPDRLMRFEREAKTLASLNHPHIAQIYGLEQAGGTSALVMELVEGDDLSQRIARGAMPIDEALPIAKQIAEALEAAHEQGIIHRDLKPANIKVRQDGTVKVLDFGLAKALDHGSGVGDQASAHLANSPTMTSPATMRGVIIGTAAYMAPEQAKGRSVDKRADIWAFGVVLHEMLTGRRLFAAEDLSETLAAVLTRDLNKVAMPQHVSARIRTLVQDCLVRDPRQRLRDMGDARIAIQHALADPVADASAPAAGAAGSPRVAWGVAAASLIAAAFLGFAQFGRDSVDAAPVHLSIDMPANTESGFFVLSPDGRSMTMTTDAIGGISIQSFDTGEIKALPGTQGRSLFWSPDSQSVGFIAGAALKIVSASGGPPQTLCEGHGASLGGAWSPNGTIVFSTLRGLSRVAAAGGPCTELVGSEVCRGFCRHPVFLPDGDHFLYVNLAEDESVRGLYVASLAEPVGRRLLADRSSAIFVPDALGSSTGRLVFVRQGTLMAQPFDAAALRLSGQPETVAQNVEFTVDLGRIAASTDNHGTLMFVRNASRDKRLVWFDRAGVERGEVAAPVPAGGVIAPDGRRLAMPRADASGTLSVWTRDLNRNQELRISNGATPVWAPDSQHLVFGGAAGLVVKNVNNEAEETLVAGAGQQIWPSDWSRDNRWLVYSLTDQATQSDIWLLADPSRPSPERRPQPWLRTPASESHAQISPDGRWIVYTSETQVYLRPFSGAALSPNQWALSDASTAAFEPRWRGDSKELFFLTGNRGVGRKALMSVAISATAMPPVGVPTQLFEFQSTSNVIWQNRFLYSPSADGQRFLTAVHTAAYRPSLEMIRNWGGTGRSK